MNSRRAGFEVQACGWDPKSPASMPQCLNAGESCRKTHH